MCAGICALSSQEKVSRSIPGLVWQDMPQIDLLNKAATSELTAIFRYVIFFSGSGMIACDMCLVAQSYTAAVTGFFLLRTAG